MTTTWTPQPGTIPHRALAILRKLGPGESIASADLADRLDADPVSLSTCMAPAKRAGVVKAERVPGKGSTFWWSVGDGKPPALPSDHEPDAPLPRRAPSTPTPRAELFPGVAANAKPPKPGLSVEQYVERIGADSDKPAQQFPFNACRYVDGSVIVVGVAMRDDGAVIFTPQQAAQLWQLGGAA